MTHEEALAVRADERYLAGDMSDLEAARYEDHYFQCQECGQWLLVAMARRQKRARRVKDGLRLAVALGLLVFVLVAAVLMALRGRA